LQQMMPSVEIVFQENAFVKWRQVAVIQNEANAKIDEEYKRIAREYVKEGKKTVTSTKDKLIRYASKRIELFVIFQAHEQLRHEAACRQIFYLTHSVEPHYRQLKSWMRSQFLFPEVLDVLSLRPEVNLPSRQLRMDLTEGPARQRSKLEIFNDFYSNLGLDIDAYLLELDRKQLSEYAIKDTDVSEVITTHSSAASTKEVENQIGRARATSVDVQSLLRAATSAVSADLPESPAVDSKSDEVFEKDDGQKEDGKESWRVGKAPSLVGIRR